MSDTYTIKNGVFPKLTDFDQNPEKWPFLDMSRFAPKVCKSRLFRISGPPKMAKNGPFLATFWPVPAKNDQNDQNDQKVTTRVIQNMTMTKTVKTRKNPKKRGFKKWSKTVFSKLKKPKKSGPKPKNFDRAGTRFLKSKKKFSPVLKSFSKT